MKRVTDYNSDNHIILSINTGFFRKQFHSNLEWKLISSHPEQHLIALMVWDKNNAALIVIKQKVFITNWESEWEGGEVILYPNLPRRKTDRDLGTSLEGGSTKMCVVKKKMWNIWAKRVLHCTSELSPTTSQLLPTVTNHWALNTNFAHLFLNILKEIHKFKCNERVTHAKAKFAFTGFCTEVNPSLTAHTKLDRKLFQGRAGNFDITNRAFSHDVTSDILVS